MPFSIVKVVKVVKVVEDKCLFQWLKTNALLCCRAAWSSIPPQGGIGSFWC